MIPTRTLLPALLFASVAGASPFWSRGPDAPAALSGRFDHAMAYDASRGVSVLFGGGYGTFEYDGSSWASSTAAGGPSNRSGCAMAYDTTRGRVVMFGGAAGGAVQNDTWELTKDQWIAGPAAPPALTPRAQHAMAHDAGRGLTVLFGGKDASGTWNDTWHYDGTSWTPGPPSSPGLVARQDHAMAYDAGRGRTVLFGGADGQNLALGDVWELDATGWSPGPGGPAARYDHAMVYDVALARVWVLGGDAGGWQILGDSWLYDGAAWQPGPPTHPRARHAAAYDARRSRVVLVGSRQPGSDTWELDGGWWLRGADAAATSLAPRYDPAMTYDSRRNVVIAFGGENDGSPFAQNARNDTWEFDGREWRKGPDAPPGLEVRHEAAMAYDASRRRVVMFGGYNQSGHLADAWEYDGASWIAAPSGPPARGEHAMAYHPGQGKVVLFGGHDNGNMDDTWLYDGSQWTAASSGPPARSGPAMAYHAALGRVILHGGVAATYLGDTWLFDGVQWTAGTSGPPARVAHAMAYEDDRGVAVVFGGYGSTGTFSDTWELGITGWTLATPTPSPSARTSHAMASATFMGGLVTFGGNENAGMLGDTWIYRCLTIAPTALADGTVGSPYAATLTAAGGGGAYIFSVSTGTLPPGLGLSPGGVLSGTPTTPGDYRFTVKAVDGTGCAGGNVHELRVSCAQPITVGPPSLPVATQGAAYGATLTVSGGTPPHTFALASGTLPQGLTLSASGVLSGTPQMVGAYGLHVRATDATGCPGSAIIGLAVVCPSPLLLSPGTLPNGVAGSWYSQALTVTGGTSPYGFTVVAGSLPPGLSVGSPSAAINGTPRATGTFSFTLGVFDSRGCYGSRAYTITIVCGNVTLSPPVLPTGAVGASYYVGLSAAGGLVPYGFSVTSGTLPPGLALSGATITGTPASVGSWSFQITATDAAGCPGSKSYTIDVVTCGTITLSPSTLPDGYVTVPYSAVFTAAGSYPPFTFSIAGGSLPPNLYLQTGGYLSGTPTTTGTYQFTVRATDSLGCTGTRDYTLVIDCRAFDILPPTAPPGRPAVAYSMGMYPTNASAPYTFFLDSGVLPPGLSIAGYYVTGTPTTLGTYVSTIGMVDAAGCYASPRTYTIDIACGVTFQTASLPRAILGRGYLVYIYATGGAAPYSYQLTSGSLPPGLTLSSAGRITGAPTRLGSYPFTVQVTDAGGCQASQPLTLEVWTPADLVAGRGAGMANGNRVRVFRSDGSATPTDFDAYSAGAWGARVGVAELDGSGNAEMVTGPGPGPALGPQVRGFLPDGTPMPKVNFYAYGTLNYGVNPGSGDIDGDLAAEILTAPGPGPVFGPQIRGFNVDGGAATAIAKVNFYAYATLRYGAHVSAARLDADGFAEILSGAGPGPTFAPIVRGFDYDGSSVRAIAKVNFAALPQPAFGVIVAGGDLDGDGFGEIGAAPGPGPALLSRAVGFDYDGAAVAPLPGCDIVPFPALYGGRLSIGGVTDDASAELVAGPGPDPGASPEVRSYDYAGATLTLLPNAVVPFPGGFGVDVAAGPLGL